MPELEITITAKLDGQPLSSPFPIRRRIVTSEVQKFDFTRPQAITDAALPISELEKKLMLLLAVDKETQVALNEDFEKPVKLKAGGILLLLNSELSFSGPTFQNTESGDTRLEGIGAG